MVNVCILTGYGINSDYESAYAFQVAGAEDVKRIHVNKFIKKRDSLENYDILMFPGGFAFGDDLGSGRVLANKFRFLLRRELSHFLESKKLILGVCNGFQVLVKMGILPAIDRDFYTQSVSLVENKSGQFEDRWVSLKSHDSVCIWTKNFKYNLDVPVRHGEGRFVVKDKEILTKLWEKKMVALTYDPDEYPHNPNGSFDSIAGICDETGCIFGMMPHPECHITKYHHPQWTRGFNPPLNGLAIFKNGVDFARENL